MFILSLSGSEVSRIQSSRMDRIQTSRIQSSRMTRIQTSRIQSSRMARIQTGNPRKLSLGDGELKKTKVS